MTPGIVFLGGPLHRTPGPPAFYDEMMFRQNGEPPHVWAAEQHSIVLEYDKPNHSATTKRIDYRRCNLKFRNETVVIAYIPMGTPVDIAATMIHNFFHTSFVGPGKPFPSDAAFSLACSEVFSGMRTV